MNIHMNRKAALSLLVMLIAVLLAGPAEAGSMPVVTADKTYFDVKSGLHILEGNVRIEIRNRVITAGQAKVSMGSFEVWGSGGVTVTQGDIFFSGDSVYVYGHQDRADIDGGVYFKRTGLEISADRVQFNWRSKLATFNGNVHVNQNGNTWTADSLTYNVNANTIL
ncbi:MAG TPA: LptA/OstA family protein [Selenomonadales bacterium]|nr:LptA/OstA family protein [Selenomonadales bacterium]